MRIKFMMSFGKLQIAGHRCPDRVLSKLKLAIFKLANFMKLQNSPVQ